ncbi:hypothetical protein C8R45DRAFT_1214695 [Mycena sanguinolenta]|nr:hypothetical protein C8R45DRAFT_1214695 [Mycena sanguinolenta]
MLPSAGGSPLIVLLSYIWHFFPLLSILPSIHYPGMKLGYPGLFFSTPELKQTPRFPWALAQRTFLVPMELAFRYGAEFCTTLANGGPCTSNCDAKAQCGPNAPAGQELCPLNVCCSQFGFCGTTDDFCGTGCMSNCNPPPPASCGGEQQTALTRRIGYYEGWAPSRSCMAWTPSSMNVDALTHLHFAFAYVSSTFEVIEMTPGDSELWSETTALKSRNPSLKVFLSIGGWTFNDPPTSGIFSALAGSTENTNVFIQSVLSIMAAYSFDGIDIDWEYPVAEDRGGSPGDKNSYVTMLKAIKAAFSPYNYGLSFTAPSSYWYLQNFDLPNMLGDGAADWVNVMTYDLHGVWDSPADYIGSIVLAHTNLTEIMQTFQLFANVGVDPSKINLGIGFYGRSYQLVSADCTDPGCPFAGAAPAGPCSANPGTLMFSEIETIVQSAGTAELVFDEVAAVKYLVYDDIDWVSYDDQQTLAMKLQYANSICLGGTFVWSLDQDDNSYTALSALWSDVTANNASFSFGGDQCTYTGCGLSCPTDYTLIGSLQQNPITLEACNGLETSSVCCPVGDAPLSCDWRGAAAFGICDGTCLKGEVLMGLGQVGPVTDQDGVTREVTCIIGQVALCCQSSENVAAYCKHPCLSVHAEHDSPIYIIGSATECGDHTCASGFTAMTTVSTGPDELNLCTAGLDSTLCCEDEIGLTNCEWYGSPPFCLDNACPLGQTVIYTDYQGDATSACLGGIQRKYCCDTPNAATFSPVNSGDVFPDSETVGDTLTFAVDYDDNEGTADDTVTGDGSSGLGDDGLENDSPFASVFISSPNAESVSSLDLESDWVVADCDATSDQPQTVNVYCTCPIDDEDCGCGHVFLGKAADTIVKMPSTCGLGPYARVVSLQVHPDQTVVFARFAGRKRDTDPVYSLSFDYAFTDIAEENGPVYMRADMTDMPGYWDAIIDSPPDEGTTSVRKRNLNFHQPRGLEYMEKRWFGAFGDWLSKLNTLTAEDSISRNYHWSDTYTIFHQEESCPNFQSSLDISVSGFASVNTQFGYYLEATILPPAVQQAYVYFKAGAGAEGENQPRSSLIPATDVTQSCFYYHRYCFGLLDQRSLRTRRVWLSRTVRRVFFVYYPGLLTLGPSLHLYGELSGELSLSGSLKTSVSYTFPSLDLSFGKQDSNAGESNLGNPVAPTDNFGGADYSFGWNVELSGSADAHLIPSLQFGVSVLGGILIDAQVFVEADLYAGLTLSGSVSNTIAPNICVGPQIGVDLNAGLTGSVLFWEPGPLSTTFYSAQSDWAPKCFGSVTEPADGSSRKRSLPESAVDATPVLSGSFETGERRSFEPRKSASHPAHAVYDGRTVYPTSRWERGLPGASSYTSDLHSRAVPFLPGSLFCPATDSDITSTATNCDPYSGDATPLSRRDVRSGNASDDQSEQEVIRHNLVQRADDSKPTLKTCGAFTISVAAYAALSLNGYYDLANPSSLDGAIKSYTPAPPFYTFTNAKKQPGLSITRNGATIYGREHVYEQSMSSLFIDYLAQFPDVWDDGSDRFCLWAEDNLWNVPSYMPAGSTPVVDQIGKCYPSIANSKTVGIPVLEQRANEYKQSAFYVTQQSLDPGTLTVAPGIVNSATFTGSCPSLQVSTLRSLAMITPFMDSVPAKDQFLQTNNCIRDVYRTWYTAYEANGPVAGVPNVTVFIGTYNSWVKDIVQGIQPAIVEQMETLIKLYNGKDTTAVDVKLSTNSVLSTWAKVTPPVPAGTAWTPPGNLNTAVTNLISIEPVKTSDLTTLMNNAPVISWGAMLP